MTTGVNNAQNSEELDLLLKIKKSLWKDTLRRLKFVALISFLFLAMIFIALAAKEYINQGGRINLTDFAHVFVVFFIGLTLILFMASETLGIKPSEQSLNLMVNLNFNAGKSRSQIVSDFEGRGYVSTLTLISAIRKEIQLLEHEPDPVANKMKQIVDRARD